MALCGHRSRGWGNLYPGLVRSAYLQGHLASLPLCHESSFAVHLRDRHYIFPCSNLLALPFLSFPTLLRAYLGSEMDIGNYLPVLRLRIDCTSIQTAMEDYRPNGDSVSTLFHLHHHAEHTA